jgi:hypothetical protein
MHDETQQSHEDLELACHARNPYMNVQHAARIMSVAHGGQVLLSQTTHDLVEHDLPEDVSLRDLGEHRLKDLQRPSHLYQLVVADLPAKFPPLKTRESQPNNLPIQLTPFIGRAREVAAVQNLLHRGGVRLVTLTGPGGSGKTRLGLQVAASLSDVFPDGVYVVNLAPISDPTLVVPTIAQALDVKETAGQSQFALVSAFLHENWTVCRWPSSWRRRGSNSSRHPRCLHGWVSAWPC